MQQVLYKIYLDKGKPRRLERPKCHAVSSWRLASRPRPQLDSRTRLKKLSVESAESTHTGWQLTNGPLIWLCSPKTITHGAKIQFKRSKGLVNSFKKRYCMSQQLNQYWRYTQKMEVISFMIFMILINEFAIVHKITKISNFHDFCHYFQTI